MINKKFKLFKNNKLFYFKIVLSILLLIIAIIPIYLKSDNLFVQIIMSLLLLILFSVNVVIIVIEENDKNRREEENKKLGREKKDLIKLNSELDNYVNKIDINIRLNGSYKFADLNPIYLGYEFMVYDKKIDIKEVLVSNDGLRMGNETILSYKIYDEKRGGPKIYRTLYGK